MRKLILTLALTLMPLAASAIEAPAGQTRVDDSAVLRGRFMQEHQTAGVDAPARTSGHFVIAPSHGLIWGMEKPLPTSTIVTADGMAQDLGGMAVKLPSRNLRHLYTIVGGALAGDWSGVEKDFVIKSSSKNGHWQMLLTPRAESQAKLPYTNITVSGSRFVENIVLAKADGSNDTFSFSDAVLSKTPLNANETHLFNEVAPTP